MKTKNLKPCFLHHKPILLLLIIITLTSSCTFLVRGSGKSDQPTLPDTDLEPGETTESDHITQYGITFYFNESRPVGTYANGDYWVQGPVTITRITPENRIHQDRHLHGWEINPAVRTGPEDYQGFDSILSNFSTDKIPKLPKTISGHNSSIVKAVSLGDCTGSCYPALEKAAVLTVVTNPPPGNQLRPSYTGAPHQKIIRTLADIQYQLLPEIIDSSIEPRNYTDLLERQKPLKFDHIAGNQMRSRPRDNLNMYLPYATREFGDAILFTMSDYQKEKRHELLTHLVQHGLDWLALLEQGYHFPRGGGETTGAILVPVFTATILDCPLLKEIINSVAGSPDSGFFPYEERTLQLSKSGMPIYGHRDSRPDHYWRYFIGGYGSATVADSHFYIDGQREPGTSYQVCCSTGFWKQMVLIFNLFPQMKEVWYHQPLEEYVQRWVLHGVWTLPDACAPYDGNNQNYGISYGPDPESPTDCIKNGIGRFPQLHGTKADRASGSRYADALWPHYYQADPDTAPFAAIISSPELSPIKGTILIKASAFAVHGLKSVEFLINDSLIGNPQNTPSDGHTSYQLSWDSGSVQNGTQTLKARATDDNGNHFTTPGIEIRVEN